MRFSRVEVSLIDLCYFLVMCYYTFDVNRFVLLHSWSLYSFLPLSFTFLFSLFLPLLLALKYYLSMRFLRSQVVIKIYSYALLFYECEYPWFLHIIRVYVNVADWLFSFIYTLWNYFRISFITIYIYLLQKRISDKVQQCETEQRWKLLE